MTRFIPWIAVAGLLLAGAEPALAGRCGTGSRGEGVERFVPLRPAQRRAVAVREAAPVVNNGASVYTTEHFRVLWGNGYDAGDPQWADPDDDGVPTWVEVLAEALEEAHGVQTALGFPGPYGEDTYYIDAYVGNTGVVSDGHSVTIGSNYYALTEIDRDYDVAYFVFNDDFSAHTSRELEVLRATAAHELFHAVQRALGYPWDAEGPWDGDEYISDARWRQEGWWVEATATWMEEISEPEVDDYASYVQDFLATPHEALNSMDGLREYGAAIFPGYLWLHHGGESVLQDIFQDAYAAGLEEAIRDALFLRGEPELEEVVSTFWARAAAPDVSVWPDAELYKATNIPRLQASASSLPLRVEPSSALRPGRFGANLLRVPASQLPAPFGMQWTDPVAAWRVAVRGTGAVPVQLHTPVSGVSLSVGEGGHDWTYLAVVNVSADSGARAYSAEWGDDGLVDTEPTGRAGDGDSDVVIHETQNSLGEGGCFLTTLR